MSIKKNVVIVGGGAAGFFAAIHVKINYPLADVVVLEKTKKLLSKVKVSGGGRCNVTNGCTNIKELAENYPRGSKQLRKAFGYFSTADTMKWFEERNVPLVVQEDNCVFPVSQNSQSIIDCFLSEAKKLGVVIRTDAEVVGVKRMHENFTLDLADGEILTCSHLIVTAGGYAKFEKFNWIANLGIDIVEPVPSLFTFNMPNEKIKELMGIVVENACATIQSTKLKADGPLLITHWGMSGPAILKLSAFGARILFEKKYTFSISINWLNLQDENEVRSIIESLLNANRLKQIVNVRPQQLPQRLWHYLVEKINIPITKIIEQLSVKEKNKLINVLVNDTYQVEGKTTFKEEFVTAGGVALEGVSFKSMQSKKVKNLYFAGEVLDIDGITGGYNFQAAWTTAYLAAKLLNED